MNINITLKRIKEMCGEVSFKRGDYFYRNNKVTFTNQTPHSCHATVAADEDFYVTIEQGRNGQPIASCSCPKLASFKKDCQHIAAVLLALYDQQEQLTTEGTAQSNNNQDLTDSLLTIFSNQPVRSSAHQLHFENRQTKNIQFLCQPVTTGDNQNLIAISVRYETQLLTNIRDFLEHVRQGRPYSITKELTYNPKWHCFQKETDDCLQQLFLILDDEKLYKNAVPDTQVLPIPSSIWGRILPLLEKAPDVLVQYNGLTFQQIAETTEPLPLQFFFTEENGQGNHLQVDGFNKLVILDSYQSVLFNGRIKPLEAQDFGRLQELQKMLALSGTDRVPVQQNQVPFFFEKVIPGLKKLGEVSITEEMANKWRRIPLVPKLYLDRVKDRLLAGLEFHYDNLVIDPNETKRTTQGTPLVRDWDKEELILELMEESAFIQTEGGYFLHNEDLEFEFLTEKLPKLQKLVQVYATTAVRNRIFRGNAKPKIRVKAYKDRTNWLEFKFEMDGIPESQIREVLAALEEQRKYYRLPNGSLLSLQTREYEEIQRFLQSAIPKTNELADGWDVSLEQSLQLLDTVEASPIFTQDESFKEFLERLHHPEKLAFMVPARLEPILKDYQKDGFKWMKSLASYGFGGILADDMGLGKTLQSITFLVSVLPEIRKNKQPALVVCPASVTYNWLSELRKFAPEVNCIVIDGTKEERHVLLEKGKEVDVLILSYPILRREYDRLEKQFFHTVFFDEAQAFKNPLSQTARAAKRIQSAHRFALTGTPVENSLEELWSLFHVVMPGLFLGLKEYSKLSRKAISLRIRPFLLRRMKENVLLDLPEKVEARETVELLPEQKKLYAAYLAKLRHDTLKHLDKDTLRKNKIKILAGLTRLRQLCCHPALFVDGYNGSSAKFKQLIQILEESRHSGRRVLIFSQFTAMLAIIGRELTNRGFPFFYLDGQTPSEERVEICDRFNRGERDLFLISLKAGGTGLNLMGADTVILYDTWWNPAVEEQAMDRAHRMGQQNPVQVIKLVARGTIEEKMNELQDKKRELIGEVIDSDEKMAASLSEEDIRELLNIK